jgi:hypothetical protein
MGFDYDGDRFDVIVIHQWRDGLVASAGTPYRCAIGTGSTGSARSKPNTRL